MSSSSKRVVAYYQSCMMYKILPVENIQAGFTTDLIFAFVGVNKDGTLRIIDRQGHIVQEGLERFNYHKHGRSTLRTLLAIGGWNETFRENFATVAASRSLRETFIKECLEYCRKYDFDGIDLDWEYPKTCDRANFTTLVKEMSTKFDSEGLYLTAAVAASPTMLDRYNVPKLSQYLDYINLMAYDFTIPTENGRTGHNAPLPTVKKCVSAWIDKGADPDKLNLGIPAYGRSFTLKDANKHRVGDRSPCAGFVDTYSYTKLLKKIETGEFDVYDDEDNKVPYMVKDRTWISYDDEDSVRAKVSYARRKGLGGVMLWSMDQDDPPNHPLLNIMNEINN